MIGHFVNILTTEEEDRVLTGKLHRHMMVDREGCDPGCILQVISGTSRFSDQGRFSHHYRDVAHMSWATDMRERFEVDARHVYLFGARHWSIGYRYDALCQRFGVERIAKAIRNRILTNRIYRELSRAGVVDLQEVGR